MAAEAHCTEPQVETPNSVCSRVPPPAKKALGQNGYGDEAPRKHPGGTPRHPGHPRGSRRSWRQ